MHELIHSTDVAAGVYLHIPFCKSRCSYCDFATDVYRSGDAVEQYVKALCREIELFGRKEVGRPPVTTERATTGQNRARQCSASFAARLACLPTADAAGSDPSEPGTSVLGKDKPSADADGSDSEVGARLFSLPPAHADGSDGMPTVLTDDAAAAGGRVGIDTIYFGGGTPSLLSPRQLEKILTAVDESFSVASGAEITIEMNPGTVSSDALAAYKSLGVNRASFGVQTFDDAALRQLARGHTADDARDTFAMLRGAGFDNVSFDLIAGLPGQTLGDWECNLGEALSMRPDHLSLYLLEIHEGTPLAAQLKSGRRPLPDEDLAAAMYETMLERAAAAGYAQYEISNFARPGFESRHNTKYWRLAPVFGFGVSAHSFDGRHRFANTRDTPAYVAAIESGNSAETTRESSDVAAEFIFLGLRMSEGIDTDEFNCQFGGDFFELYRSSLDELKAAALIDITHSRIKLTQRGMLFSNEVFTKFI